MRRRPGAVEASLVDAGRGRRAAARRRGRQLTEARRSLRADAAEAASSTAARVDALQLALDAARARAGAERLAGVDGVLGTLLDLIEIDDGWGPAVEAALGESLTAVVVDDPTAGRRALDALRDSSTSGAVIALGARPFVAAEPRARSSRSARTPGRRGRAWPNCSTACSAHAVCVDDITTAVDAALAHPDAVVVTAAGDRFGLSGWRIGAASTGATAAALDDAVRAARGRRRTSWHGLDAALDRGGARAASPRSSAEADLVRSLDANDARFSAASEGLASAQREVRELRDRARRPRGRRWSNGEASVEREQRRIDELTALLPGLESDEQAEVDAARARGELRAELDRRAAALSSRRTELEVRNAGLHERQQLLEQQLAETERRLAADVRGAGGRGRPSAPTSNGRSA